MRIHLAGIDLVRGSDGVMRVLEDNLRVPSGISYVVENREALTRVFPGLFLEQQVQPVAGYVADACWTRCGRPRRPAWTTRPSCC